jgi:hypothetical protein
LSPSIKWNRIGFRIIAAYLYVYKVSVIPSVEYISVTQNSGNSIVGKEKIETMVTPNSELHSKAMLSDGI